MNKFIIPIIIIVLLAAGIGVFFVFQKSAFPEPSLTEQQREEKVRLQEEINVLATKLEILAYDEAVAEAKKTLAVAQEYLNENDFNHAGFFLKKTFGLYKERASHEKKSENEVICTQEAKVCPDGSTVGRVGPSCEFAPCPAHKGPEKSVPIPKPTPKPIPATKIPASLFGLHFYATDVPWPTVPFSSNRLWGRFTSWARINTAEGVYDWKLLDSLSDLARDNNIDLLYTFGATPRWASSDPTSGLDELGGLGQGSAAPPRDMKYWDDFVRAIATHNKERGGRIKYWEIWNEWNLPELWTGDTATMVTMAQRAYQIIKSIDPNALVLAPDVAPTNPAGNFDNLVADYLNRFLAAGGGNYVDVITFHGYRQTPEHIVSLVDAIRKVMAANGQSAKPLWDTEGSWGTGAFLFNLDKQAAYVARSYLLHWSMGVERFYWYQWIGANPDKSEKEWGVLWDSRGGIQKSGIAYGEIYKWLVGAAMTSNCAAQSDGTTWICGLSRPGGYEAQAIWNTAGNLSIQAPIQFSQYRSLDGKKVAILSGGSVTIGIKPILLETKTADE